MRDMKEKEKRKKNSHRKVRLEEKRRLNKNMMNKSASKKE